jgi:hypothetical protein
MSVSTISGVVVWQLMFDVVGDFEVSVECVLSWEEYMLHCGTSGGFGTEGILGNRIDYICCSCLESMFSL